MLSERPDVAGGNYSAGPDPSFVRQERAPRGAGPTLGSLQPGGTQATEPPTLGVREPDAPSHRPQRLRNVLEDSGNVLGKREHFNRALFCPTGLGESSL